MNRTTILGLAFLAAALVITACGGDAATATRSPTSVPTDTPTQVPTASPMSTVPAAGSSPTPTETTSSQPSETLATHTWTISEVDSEGAKPSLDVGPYGTPHIAYMLEDMPGFVKHAVLGPGGWDISTIETGYFYGPLDIVVGSDGTPHVAWHDHDVEDGAYSTLSGGEWETRKIRDSGHDGWDINLTLDSQGVPHVVSIDPSQFGSRDSIEYSVPDGDGWAVEKVGSGPVKYEFGTTIAIDSTGRPHIAWFDDGTEELKYAVKDSGAWAISTVDADGDAGRFPSMALDSLDNPVISYYEPDGDTAGHIKLARWNGQAWDIQRIDRLEAPFLGFLGARKNSSLVLDGQDNPVVAYSDERAVKVAAWDGSTWAIETVHTAGSDPLGQQVSLSMDPSGGLHLTFAVVTRKSPPGVKGPIMYASGTPAG